MLSKLAVNGGTPVRTRPLPSSLPGASAIGEEEKQAVLRVLESAQLFRFGRPYDQSEVGLLEREFAEKVGTPYALAVNSGTSALITGLVACGIGPGAEVILPGYTFVSSAAAILSARAIPIIAEVDESLTLDPQDLERKITPRTKAVMPVHMRGTPCRMEEILEIARRYGLKVIEDVAQADGGCYRGRRLGSLGDIGCFSLQYYKIITSGEGGMVTTHHQEYYHRAVMYHDSALAFWRPEMGADPIPGVNFRMSEIAGALARVQLRKLDDLIARMRRAKQQIKEQIEVHKDLQFREEPDPEGDTAICLIFFLPSVEKAQEFATALSAEGIPAGTIYNQGIPDRHIYSHWTYVLRKTPVTSEGCPWTCGWHPGDVRYSEDMCPRTLDLLGRAVHLNISPWLTPEDCEDIATAVNKVAQALL